MNNNLDENDTVAALATAVGGGVAIIRISGPNALAIGNKVWRGKEPLATENERKMLLGKIVDPITQDSGDQALAVYMKKPKSYTGEDVVELQCHGGNFTAKHTLMTVFKAGARHAEPGEFTKRAFLNGRLDLTQAEAVNDLIHAQSEKAMQVATRQLNGRLGNSVKSLYHKLTEIHSEVEVRMDFIEEDLDWTSSSEVIQTLEDAHRQITEMLKKQKDGEVLRHGVKAIIGGPPNAGKSSFLNQVLGHERAIVTNIAGTTRDTLEEMAQIRGIPLRLTDTAGIRESDDIVEKTGIKRSLQMLNEADIIFWLMDLTRPLTEQMPPEGTTNKAPTILVFNKIDLISEPPVLPEIIDQLSPHKVFTSFSTGQGLEELYNLFEKIIWEEDQHEMADFALNARHAALLEEANKHIEDSINIMKTEQWELIAVNLRGALHELGQILGETVLPDILHNIFSKYCIGK